MDIERISNWEHDILTLKKELSYRHKNLFYKRNKDDMENEITTIIGKLPNLNDDEILVALTSWIAFVGDSHTKILCSEKSVYPVTFYWFEEGIYLTHASHKYNFLINGKLEGINGINIKQVVEKLRPLISYENEYLFKERLPHLLISPKILHGLKINNHVENIVYNIKTMEGKKIDAIVKLSLGKYLDNNSPEYWFEYMNSYKTLYFQYNSCTEDHSFPHKALISQLIQTLNENQVDKLVIDLRYNPGGNSALLSPFFDSLSELKALNRFKKLYALIGRSTFSSAFLHTIRLKTEGAVLVGEPTGSKLNFFGEIEFFKLPNSGLTISYPTRYFNLFKKDKSTLIPDVQFPVLFHDYLTNYDPAIDYVLKQ